MTEFENTDVISRLAKIQYENGIRSERLDKLIDLVEAMNARLTAHMEDEEGQIVKLSETLDGVLHRGFLKNEEGEVDLEGHLRFHKAEKTAQEVAQERKKKFVDQVIEKGGWAAFLFICWSVWEAIKSKVHFG